MDEPTGVRLISPGGRIVPCDVIREPDQDQNGYTTWLAVPRERVSLVLGEWRMAADMLPARSHLVVHLWDTADEIPTQRDATAGD